MFKKKEKFKKEQSRYRKDAIQYIDNPEKTEGLLKKATRKALDNKGSLGEAWGNLQVFFELIKSYSSGEYRAVSSSTILTVIGAIIYFVSPLDFIPDFVMGLGIVDDVAVISYTLKKLSSELDEFKNWKLASNVQKNKPLD